MIINEETIRAACNYLAETLIKKNHDYGNSVEEQYKDYGDTSLHLRIEDKLRRVKNLANKDALVPEDEAETYLDAGGYSILAYILKKFEEDRKFKRLGIPNPDFDPESLRKIMDQAIKEAPRRKIATESKPYTTNEPPHAYFDADDQH